MSTLSKLLNETKNPGFHMVHVDAHSINPNHGYLGDKNATSHKLFADHLKSIGFGHLAKRSYSVGYDDVSLPVHDKDTAHFIASKLNKRLTVTKDHANKYGAKNAAEVRRWKVHPEEYRRMSKSDGKPKSYRQAYDQFHGSAEDVGD